MVLIGYWEPEVICDHSKRIVYGVIGQKSLSRIEGYLGVEIENNDSGDAF